MASAAIFVLLLLVLVEVTRSALGRLGTTDVPEIDLVAFILMIGTLLVNVAVVRYESAAGRRLNSELLIADSKHTNSDVLTSLAVLVALVGVRMGFPLADPIAGLVVAGFIGHAGFSVAREASSVLTDRMVMDQEEIRRIVLSVPDTLGCHQIRTRGSADHVFLDMHLWLRPDMRLDEAHWLSHVVKDRLMAEFSGLADVIIHIEPPPGRAR